MDAGGRKNILSPRGSIARKVRFQRDEGNIFLNETLNRETNVLFVDQARDRLDSREVIHAYICRMTANY